MKINEKQLEEHLMDIYKYHTAQANVLHEKAEVNNWEDCYNLGKHDGAISTAGAIMLLCFGGEKTFDLWQSARDQAEEDPDER